MSESPEPIAPEQAPSEQPGALRLYFCPRCGYDLGGLPPAGKCPECGFAYSAQMFSLRGRDQIRTRWLVAGVGFILLWSLPIYHVAVSLLVFPGIAAALLSVGFFAQNHRARQRWVLFTGEGASMRNRPGEHVIVPWSGFRRVRFHRWRARETPDAPGKWRLLLYREPISLFQSDGPAAWLLSSVLEFEVHASEAEAQAMVREISRRLHAAWGGLRSDR